MIPLSYQENYNIYGLQNLLIKIQVQNSSNHEHKVCI